MHLEDLDAGDSEGVNGLGRPEVEHPDNLANEEQAPAQGACLGALSGTVTCS